MFPYAGLAFWPSITLLLCSYYTTVLIRYALVGRTRKFKDRHVLITGGSKGIGFELANLFARMDAKVTIAARGEEALLKAVEELQRLNPGLRANYRIADMRVDSQVSSAVQGAEKALGPIDTLVCNAGTSSPGYFLDQGVDVLAKQMDLNLLGYCRVLSHVLPAMIERKSGQVVLIASSASLVGLPGMVGYCASKFAVRGLADALRYELQGTGVSVSIGYPPDTVTPGYLENEQGSTPIEATLCGGWPMSKGPVFQPSEVAKCLMGGIVRQSYHLPNNDFIQTLLISLMSGISPRQFDAVTEVLLSPITTIISLVVQPQFDGICRKHAAERTKRMLGK